MSVTTTTDTRPREAGSRPIAYVTLKDAAVRDRVVQRLYRAGWAVRTPSTGFHLIEQISDLIEARTRRSRPDLIVIDAHARGCAGTTIAAGLRELGITIPIVIVTGPGETVRAAAGAEIVDRDRVEQVVARLAGVTIAA